MNGEVTALLAFCEGPHDVAFVRRVLRHNLGFEKVEWRFSEFPAVEFSKLGDRDWMTVEWEVDANDGVAATTLDIGSYVWCGEDGLGTLEDLLIRIHRVSDAGRTGIAERCLDQLFEWKVDHQDMRQRIAERARRHKGVITLLGQREKPGMSQHVVIGQTQTMKDADFIGDSRVAAFAGFMTKFLNLGVSA